MMTGARYSPIVNAGSVRLRNRESGSPPMPEAGKRCAFRLSTRIRTSPSQNAGIAKVIIITSRIS